MKSYIVTLTVVVNAKDEDKALSRAEKMILAGDYDNGSFEVEEDDSRYYDIEEELEEDDMDFISNIVGEYSGD